MPLNAGAETDYCSAPEGASETAPLLAPVPIHQWQPMNREQLETTAGGSGWRAARCYLVVLFWLAWMSMLAVAAVIVVISPKPVPMSLKWWQKCLFYQIQPELSPDVQAEGSEGINALIHSKSREEALLYGRLTFLPFNTTNSFSLSPFSNSSVSSPPVLAFLRSWGCVQFLVLLNVWPEPLSLDPAWTPSLPENWVFVASTGMNRVGLTSLYSIKLQPYEALVIKLFQPGD
ncbi:hypothetical protein XENOCAPTIV_004832 [Xenoophorus captivus]|uniref:Solute carrier family 3 member 2 N-terminal domain-containing protein n=1 Tax=Xenoophorus captivus TaxID=1517983 RepID=A0ABV0RNR6_9TELE